MYQPPYQQPGQGAYPPPVQPAPYQPAYQQGPYPQQYPCPPTLPPEVMAGSAKAGFVVAGVLLSVLSLIVTWLASRNKTDEYARLALKFSLIGTVAGIAGGILIAFAATLAFAAAFG